MPATAATAPASSARRTSSRSAIPPASSSGKPGGSALRARARSSSAGTLPRTWPPASTPWTIAASAPAPWAARASATEPHWCIQRPPVRRRGRPQKVTTTSASAAASNQSRRAKGSSTLTAIGRAVSARAALSSRRIEAAPLTAIVPSPPASETAAASSWRLSPPPIPAWTTGASMPSPASGDTAPAYAGPMSEAAQPDAPPRRRVLVVIGALMLTMLLAALDQTIVSTALPTIVGELGGLNHLSWVVTSYLLAITIVTPLYGKLGDLYGRKVVLQGALVLFLIGSALCGQAQGMTELIAFRAIQGLGGGGLMVSAQAAVGDVVSPRERGRYMGLFGARLRGRQRRRAADRRLLHHATRAGAGSSTSTCRSGCSPWSVLAVALPGASRAQAAPGRLPRHRAARHLARLAGPADHPRRHHLRLGLGRRSSASGCSRLLALVAFVAVERRADGAGAAAGALPQPGLPGHQRDRLRRRLRAVRLAHLPAALPAGGARAQPDRLRPAAGAADGRPAGRLDRLRAADLAHRPLQALPDRRHRDRRRRPAAALAARPRHRHLRGRRLHARPRRRPRLHHAGAGPRGPERRPLRAARRRDLVGDPVPLDRRLARHGDPRRDLRQPARRRARRTAAGLAGRPRASPPGRSTRPQLEHAAGRAARPLRRTRSPTRSRPSS